MNSKILRVIEQYGMLEDCTGIVVGLSGGADSMCLLDVILKNFGDVIPVFAAHLNHNLRHDEAKRDENFVIAECRKKNVELYCKSVDISSLAAQYGITEEECGRNERYAFFYEVLSKTKANKIAVAHSLSDNAETLIFNIIRGSSLHGLTGIMPVRDEIIRPLIFTSRADIESYCEENKISYVTDSTNSKNIYTRNLIRNKIIPICNDINPSFLQSVKRLKASLEHDDDYITRSAQDILQKGGFDGESLSVDVLKESHPSPAAKVIDICCKRIFNIALTHDKIYEIINSLDSIKKIQLNQDCYIKIIYGRIYFYKSDIIIADKKAVLGVNDFNGREIELKLINFNEFSSANKENCADFDKINGSIIMRSRREGDIFTSHKRNCTKTLKKLMIEKKILEFKRNRLLVLGCKDKFSDNTEIIFAETIGVSASYRVTENTKKILYINIKEL